eukprot:Trichotokara_eunicae@DN4968_c0_g1_i2.p1
MTNRKQLVSIFGNVMTCPLILKLCRINFKASKKPLKKAKLVTPPLTKTPPPKEKKNWRQSAGIRVGDYSDSEAEDVKWRLQNNGSSSRSGRSSRCSSSLKDDEHFQSLQALNDSIQKKKKKKKKKKYSALI